MPTYGMGQIFTMGLTAALAWELPHEPIHLKEKTKQDKEDKQAATAAADKRVDSFGNKSGIKTVAPVTYYHKPWTTGMSNNFYQPTKIQFIQPQQNVQYSQTEHFPPTDYRYRYNGPLPAYKDERIYYQHRAVHRRTRRDLFEKIEKFFMALNKDGIACLLKALCEVNQQPKGKLGSFVEETLKAVFTRFVDYGFSSTKGN